VVDRSDDASCLLGLEGLAVERVVRTAVGGKIVQLVTDDPDAARCPACATVSTSGKDWVLTRLLADSPDDHDWAALRHRRCSRVVAGEGRVGRAVCDDNVTTDVLAAGQGVVAGLGGCAGCRTRAVMARRLVKRSLLDQGATRTPPSPAGRPRPACRA
jgi:hypothetical protein